MRENEFPPFDTILVGAGAAGCVLANRLTEDGSRSVLLLEGGPDYGSDPADWPPDLLDPTNVWPDSHSWGFTLSGRKADNAFPLPRTRIVGGTTTVNGCIWLRGSAVDFDGWTECDNPGWSFRDMLPYFQRAESDPGGGPLAGTSGPVPVFRVADRDIAPAERAFMAAADSVGLPIVADLNRTANQTPGVGPAPKNIADGVRMNGAFTYLAPARSRRNLAIRANSPVDRVVFENGRAIGVRLVDGSEVRGREIVLCAGSYSSPAILLRSGIGPAAHLRELGIPITHHLPGVGENLLDHPLASPDRPRPRLIRPEHAPRSRSFIPVLAKARSRHAGDDIDLHVYIGQNFDESFGAWFLWITASLQFARSQGRVRLTSADPMASLDIDHAYLSNPADLEALCDGIELAERIIAAAPMQRVLEPHAEEKPPWGDAGELPAWALSRFGTTFHPSSTCRMGPAPDPMAVVDHDALVHGVAGLRVVDASIFPTGPRANIHFTVIAVAEKLADAIRHQPVSGHLEAASPAEDLMRRFKDFESALKYASRLHATQTRKGSNAPYISHLLAVAAIALEHGASEKEAIAALLHDAVEDQGGQKTLDKIRHHYGKRVARIVAACSDTDVLPKPPWRERKEAFVERLRTESYSVRLVVAADKLHNVRDILRNYRIHGDDLWSHFKGGHDGTRWYYRAVVGALTEAAKPEEHQLNALIEELCITLSLLEQEMSERSTRMRPAELA